MTRQHVPILLYNWTVCTSTQEKKKWMKQTNEYINKWMNEWMHKWMLLIWYSKKVAIGIYC